MQPVRKDLFCDLAIIGGGVGGCTAAICAARRGLHVIMFEKGVSLGGLATNGYVPQIAGGIEGICMEYTKRLDDIGQLRKVDPSKDYYRNPSLSRSSASSFWRIWWCRPAHASFTTPPAWTLKWTVQTSSAHSSIPRAA